MTLLRDLLDGAGVPVHEAERLLVVATGRAPHQLLAEVKVTDHEARRYLELVARRRAGVPLQHLEGTAQFGPIELGTDGRALVPRPETERLWEEAADRV